MAKKYFTDFERMEYVKKFRTSGLSLRRFAMINGVNRETLRDWVNAYQDLEGKFIRLNFDNNETGILKTTDDITINVLTKEQIAKKSRHFSRFDHSIVIVEYKDIKITTSLEQALAILERIK